MFKIDIQDLTVGKSYWVLRIDKDLINNNMLPQQYKYLGKIEEADEPQHFLFEELKIHYKKNGYMAVDIYDAGNYIIYPNRSRVIQVVRNVATRPVMDKMMDNIPSKYIKLLEDIKPELLI